MLKEALFFGIFIPMIAQVLGSLAANEQKEPCAIEVPVLSEGGNCKYHDQRLPKSSLKFYQDPCQAIFCNPDANRVTITGCPPPDGSISNGLGGNWPNCCPRTSQ